MAEINSDKLAKSSFDCYNSSFDNNDNDKIDAE